MSDIDGIYFEHTWYVQERDAFNIIYVKPLTKSKIPKVIVTYWKTDEAEEDERILQLQHMGY